MDLCQLAKAFVHEVGDIAHQHVDEAGEEFLIPMYNQINHTVCVKECGQMATYLLASRNCCLCIGWFQILFMT